MDLHDLLSRLLSAKLDVGATGIYWREIIGNGFGLASALLGMRRKVAAWPIGIVGNILLFTIFVGGALGAGLDTDHRAMWGQAGRQVFFLVVSVYGWVRWHQYQRSGAGGGQAVTPRWAGARGRLILLGSVVVLWVACYFAIHAIGSYNAAGDAWILTGSILATYGMARGWVEFWLIWIAVDAVGVPLLLHAQYYPTAIMYMIYGAFCLVGFISWLRIERSERDSGPSDGLRPDGIADPAIETVA